MSNEVSMPGGWTEYRPLTEEDETLFNEAINLLGVKYTPIAVSTQVVSGVNYRFRCDAQLASGGEKWEAIIEIYQTLEKESHLLGIVRLLKNDKKMNTYVPTRQDVLDATEAHSKLMKIGRQTSNHQETMTLFGWPDIPMPPMPIPIPPIPPIPDIPNFKCLSCKAGLTTTLAATIIALIAAFPEDEALIPVVAVATDLAEDIVVQIMLDAIEGNDTTVDNIITQLCKKMTAC